MKHYRYKYFSKIDYAKDFLAGRVYCQTAAFFRDYEDGEAKQVVGDEYEGTRLFRPLDGLEVNNLSNNSSGIMNAGMESITKAHEIFVFCMSCSSSDILRREFKAVAQVNIINPREFIRRWEKALPMLAKKEGNYIARKVGYYRAEALPANVWALPDMITTTKLKQFEYQDEYRLAHTSTDAFAFQNCDYKIVDRKVRPQPKLDEHHYEILALGDLSDICEMHVF